MPRTRYMNATQAAIALGRNEKTVRRWITEGKIKAERPTPRKLAIPESEIIRVKSELEQLEQYEINPQQDTGSLAALDVSRLIERIEQLEQDRKYLADRIEQLEQKVERAAHKSVASRETPEPTDATQPIDRPTHYEPRQKLTTEPTRATIAGIPDNAISITTFAEQHGVKPRTFRDHITVGIQGERITDVIERPKPSRPKETERYLTPEQQAKVLDYWRRHGVRFTLPEPSENISSEPGQEVEQQ